MSPRRDNLLNAPLAEGVRRVGFRKWYERELLSSHAHMVLAIFAVIGLLGSMEVMRGGSYGEQLLDLGLMVISGLVGFWALRRYLFLLMRAEVVANQASCEECGEYGRFKVLHDNPQSRETQVACLKCSHHWTIDSSS